jgi:hypothetical protein
VSLASREWTSLDISLTHSACRSGQ